jgi:DNA-binding PadR family transcriptional regulator
MLELAILGLLSESPMHGYELRKRLSATLGTFRAFSYGSLYPTLRKLRDAGWISEDEPELPPTADSTGVSRRAKRVYQLTADGKEHFGELLADVGPESFDDEGFGTRLAFFAKTDAEVRLKILEGRRRRVEEERDGLSTSLIRTRSKMDRYTLQLQDHAMESRDREVRWLSELIAHERAETTTDQQPHGR